MRLLLHLALAIGAVAMGGCSVEVGDLNPFADGGIVDDIFGCDEAHCRDGDGDRVNDRDDNCPARQNPLQRDHDEDGIGDLCDPCPRTRGRVCEDDDGDGIGNRGDNCPTIPNPQQLDQDEDGFGDECDPCPLIKSKDPSKTPPRHLYVPEDNCSDRDEDGVGALLDNCPATPNPDQADRDGDERGDVCDNCPNLDNRSQFDEDFDGIGDDCDDADGDGMPASIIRGDNCPGVANPPVAHPDAPMCQEEDRRSDAPEINGCDELDLVCTDDMRWGCQPDSDGDGMGDACDPCPEIARRSADEGSLCAIDNRDGDNIPPDEDNCTSIYNPDQEDRDGDGRGDACDSCPDLVTPRGPRNQDKDKDGLGDFCDPDIDGDGIPNEADYCPEKFSPSNIDSDLDGIGDHCDHCPRDPRVSSSLEDYDCDGILNDEDNCLSNANSDQADVDGDGYGDACDICPQVPDPMQSDSDDDGLGDACDRCIEPDGTRQGSGFPPTALFPHVDADGDGVCDGPEADEEANCSAGPDNCRMVANGNQADIDGDGVGNVCDNCNCFQNPGQEDVNENGYGDACEIQPEE